MYVDYRYYKSVHGGGLSEEEFNRTEPQAEAYIRYLTCFNGNVFGAESDDVKRAVCTAVDTVAAHNEAVASGEAGIKSESNDGYSVTRSSESVDGEASEALVRRKVSEAVRPWLFPGGWLRRNIRPCGRSCL